MFGFYELYYTSRPALHWNLRLDFQFNNNIILHYSAVVNNKKHTLVILVYSGFNHNFWRSRYKDIKPSINSIIGIVKVSVWERPFDAATTPTSR